MFAVTVADWPAAIDAIGPAGSYVAFQPEGSESETCTFERSVVPVFWIVSVRVITPPAGPLAFRRPSGVESVIE